ncbi:SRPBCC domain-containing protein [Actinomadura miaoliensis]|uniref:SRPBCC domain-containing protein n=1 Tax=Actinomadura miaoliensis TaxID=430685 RepID=A0ABP7VML7_9ACTN
MTVTRVDKDYDALTLTVVADFDAPVERVWRLWSDPRRLERWWGGPPGFTTAVDEHDLTPGGTVTYLMTGPDGRTSRGWWRIDSVEPPTSLEFTDGFADDGVPVPDIPTTQVRVRLTEHDGGTRMLVHSVFDSREQMDQLVRLGATDIFAQSIGRMDALLTESPD